MGKYSDICIKFRRKFNEFKDRNIVIYGTGVYAKAIIQSCQDFNIIGLLDGQRTDGYFLGKKILDYEEVLLLETEIIIVASRILSVREIFPRLFAFSKTNNIPVFYMNGENIENAVRKVIKCKANFFQLNTETMKEEIDRHDIISFDIFDTILCRKVLYPEDIFEIVENKVKKKGIMIDDLRSLRKRGILENKIINPNLTEIYQTIAQLTGLEMEQVEAIKQEEIDVEKSLLIIRKDMVDLLHYCLKKEKKVYLISDMYLPRKNIEEILSLLGIEQVYDILISCEYRLLKHDGLFNVLINKEAGNTFLHIGDNEISDGFSAAICGMDIILVKSPLEMLRNSNCAFLESVLHNVNERSLAGLVVAKLFNSPFALERKMGWVQVDDVYNIGYCFVGALITEFMLWHIAQVRSLEADKILFSARDGYLIQKLYRKIVKHLKCKGMPEGIYLQISRPVCIEANVKTEEDIKYVLEAPFSQIPPKVLQNQFQLREEEVLHYENEDLISYAMRHKEQIFIRSKELRKNYGKYIEALHLDTEKKYLFYDFVSRGSCQYYFSQLADIKIEGVYFWRGMVEEGDKLSTIPVKGYWDARSAEDKNSYVAKHYLFLETIMTSDRPSICRMDEEGNPVYFDELRTKEEIKYVQRMHRSIMDFCMEYVKDLYIDGIEINKSVGDKIYSLLSSEYSRIQCRIIDDLMLVDDWIQERVPLTR